MSTHFDHILPVKWLAFAQLNRACSLFKAQCIPMIMKYKLLVDNPVVKVHSFYKQ